MSFADWLTGLLCAWAWCVCGARPGVDMDSIKQSTSHAVSESQGWACTDFVGGRNKLHGNKRGTRPWKLYFLCICPGGVHNPAPVDFYARFDKNGNPHSRIKFCTVCPVNCLRIKRDRMAPNPLRLFANWTTTRKKFGRNRGKIYEAANEWFEAQGCLEDGKPFDSNSGRRALAGWLSKTHTPYHEGFEIHQDLPDVWSAYQPNCQKSSFGRRTQSKDPTVATAALRRFAWMLGRGARARVKHLDLQSKLMVAFLESNGQAMLAQSVVAQHRQQHGDDESDEEEKSDFD